jgi:predicted enzyme related to lactoylglutathione lyase
MAQTAEQVDHEDCAGTEMGAHGNFCWNELVTHDADRAKKFYAETIGWSFDPMPTSRATRWSAASSR